MRAKSGRAPDFWFTLPLPVDLTPPGTAPIDMDMTGVRVLGVDNNPTNLFVLREQLNSWGLRNDSSGSAEDALTLLRAAHSAGDPYHIAILDQQLPTMDGEQLARTAQGRRRAEEHSVGAAYLHWCPRRRRPHEGSGFAAYLHQTSA